MSVIDLEYEIAMTAARRIDPTLKFPPKFEDEPEKWREILSEAFRETPRWFEWAITQYLKGR